MCGRFSLFAPRSDVEARFGARFVDGYEPRYNAAPGGQLPVLPDATPARIQDAEWGLVPTWAEDRRDGSHINARAETAATKPSFRDSFAGGASPRDGDHEPSVGENDDEDGDAFAWERGSAGRCLVPADGFYEWGDTGDGRRPYRVEVDDGACFAMAGLWTRWTPTRRQSGLGEFAGETRSSEAVHTFAILTTAANDVVAPLHDRMPVILGRDEERAWLAAGDATDVSLDPFDGATRLYPVSDAVNDPRNDSPAVVEPVAE